MPLLGATTGGTPENDALLLAGGGGNGLLPYEPQTRPDGQSSPGRLVHEPILSSCSLIKSVCRPSPWPYSRLGQETCPRASPRVQTRAPRAAGPRTSPGLRL